MENEYAIYRVKKDVDNWKVGETMCYYCHRVAGPDSEYDKYLEDIEGQRIECTACAQMAMESGRDIYD